MRREWVTITDNRPRMDGELQIDIPDDLDVVARDMRFNIVIPNNGFMLVIACERGGENEDALTEILLSNATEEDMIKAIYRLIERWKEAIE